MNKNIRCKRIREKARSRYNCGGYALETFDWYRPLNLSCNMDFETDEEVNEYLEKSVDNMLKEFKDLRRIKDIKELSKDEYAIAYRVGKMDFHYMRRGDNGIWYHKVGGMHDLNSVKKEQVFADKWINPYDSNCEYTSELVLFAKKK